jgi:hypothetical protein
VSLDNSSDHDLNQASASIATRSGGDSDVYEQKVDVEAFIQEVILSKREVEIARQQFNTVSDPLLIDHIVFRLGAAEKRLNYLFQVARRLGLSLNGIHWGWRELS